MTMATKKKAKVLKKNQVVVEYNTAKVAKGVATIFRTDEPGRLLIDLRITEGSDIVMEEEDEE